MIVFDMEWNSGCDQIPLDEILQIGAVRLDRPGGRITGTFNAYIRPDVHKKLGVTARKVLDPQLFEQAAWNFPEAFAAFRQWCGGEKDFATWGNGDREVLRRNCAWWDLPELEMERVYDIQDSFSARVGSRQRIALYRAAEYCGIPDCFDCHDALNDAVYTAVLTQWLPEGNLLLCAQPKRIARLSQVGFPRQSRRKLGPYRSEEKALSSHTGREMTCPVCGEKSWVNAWHCAQPHRYYADFQCPEHGWFVCRLNLERAENGAWWGRKHVPVLTEKVKRDFYLATKGELYSCRVRRSSRRRRGRNRKKTDRGN